MNDAINDIIDGDPAQLVIPQCAEAKEDSLATAIRLANALVELNSVVEEAEADLAAQKKKRDEIGEKLLPDLLRSIGLTEITLSTGQKITIKPTYYANISAERMDAAVKWLRENNMAGIVKESVVVDPIWRERLVAASVPHQSVASIHPSTLKAFVKERIEAGHTNFPQETFGVHVVDKASVAERRR